ncbi:MAG: hypothetical protein ACT4PJ_03765 [Gemmatimonadaceae bacterium]
MTQRTDAGSTYSSYTQPAPRGSDDRSDDLSGLSARVHRQLIGYVGLALPILLLVITWLRRDHPDQPWRWHGSISAYYYTGAVAAFVGLLVALALFLFAYRGYKNKYQLVDRLAAMIAGAAALGVAFFPTRAPDGFAAAAWWTETTGVLHYVSALVLFAMFAVFSLWLFRLTGSGEQPAADKQNRNFVYLLCGIAIVVSIVWAGVAGMSKKSILVPESIALVAFAVSWLVKGRVDKSIADTARSIGSKVKGKP